MRCSQILDFRIILFKEYYLTITFTGFVLSWPSKMYVATVQSCPERTIFLYNCYTIKSHILLKSNIYLFVIYMIFCSKKICISASV